MLVNKYGRVAGSIDLAALAEMYAQTDDDDLRAHYRQVAAENGLNLGEETPAAEPESVTEPEPESQPQPGAESEADELTRLRAEAESLGVKVDGRWGTERLRAEIDEALKE